jgi:hypothetical protein
MKLAAPSDTITIPRGQAAAGAAVVNYWSRVEMNVIAMVLVACLPHTSQCKQEIQHPAPKSDAECSARAEELQKRLAGSIDDGGYQPIQVICMFGGSED